MCHLISITQYHFLILCNEGHVTDIKVVCGALLHDTIEDIDTSPEAIENVLGVAIKDIVMDVTDDKNLGKVVRKQMQIEHAAHIRDINKGALIHSDQGMHLSNRYQ